MAGLFGARSARTAPAPQIDPETLRRLMLDQEAMAAGARTSGPVAAPVAGPAPAIAQPDAAVGPTATTPALDTTASTGPVGIQNPANGAMTRTRPGMFAAAARSPSAMAAKGVLDDSMQQNATDPTAQPGYAGPPRTEIEALDNVPALNMTPNPNIADAQVQGRIHPKFFEHGGLGGEIAKVGAQALIGLGASTGNPLAMHYFTEKWADKDAQRRLGMWNEQHQVQRGEELDDRQYEDNKPKYFQTAPGSAYNQFDPTSGQTKTLYQSPTAAQDFASQYGDPGSDEYQAALRDYVLKSYGPTAMAGRTDLADHRMQNSIALKGVPTYSNLHPRAPAPRAEHVPTTSNVVAGILQKVGAGAKLSPGEQDIYNTYKAGRYRGGHGGISLAGGGSAPVKVNTPQEAMKLPPGTPFLTPDGRTKVR
jgi:hypothetical protein